MREKLPSPLVLIHPDTAAQHGIDEGDDVIIETRYGQISQVARLTDRLHPQVICAAYGWWFPEENVKDLFGWDRANFNMLTSTARLGQAFGTPNLKGINCRIRRQ